LSELFGNQDGAVGERKGMKKKKGTLLGRRSQNGRGESPRRTTGAPRGLRGQEGESGEKKKKAKGKLYNE